MKRTGIRSLAALGCTLLLAQGAAGEEVSYEMYCLNPSMVQLENTQVRFSEAEDESLIAHMAEWLNEGRAGSGSQALFPEELTLEGYEVREGRLSLNFNAFYAEMPKTREILVRAGVVRTFLQAEEVDEVEILVEGAPLTDSRGSEVGPLTGETFVELSTTDTGSYRYETFQLYFTDETGEGLRAENRTVYYRRSIPKVRVALEQLARGPLNEGNDPTLSEQVDLIGVIEEDDVCYVDFDSDFLTSVPEQVGRETVIHSVVNTVIAATGVSGVEISVDGESEVDFGEDLSLYHIFSWTEVTD